MTSAASPGEKIFDIIPYAAHCVKGATVGIFQDAITFPTLIAQTFLPHSKWAKTFSYPKECVRIDEHEIAVGYADNLDIQNRLRRMVSRVEEIKTKMGISTPVHIFLSERGDGTCLGSRCTAIVLLLNGHHIYKSEEEFDFTIAHELSHALFSDGFKSCMITTCTLIVAMLAGYFYSPWAVPMIGALSCPLSWKRCHNAEKRADLFAIKTLGTSRGAISRMSNALRANIQCRLTQNTHDRFSPEGNDRHMIFHPPLTERIAYCKAAHFPN